MAWVVLGALAVTLYFWGLEHNSAASDYAYGHDGVPPTMSTLHQFEERPGYTLAHMGRFILSMFGNSVSRGFPVSDNLVFSRICGAIVLVLALIGVAAAWWRGLFRHRALPWVCLLLFTFLTAAFRLRRSRLARRPTAADSALRDIWHVLYRVTHRPSLVRSFWSARRFVLLSIGFC